MIVRRSFSAGAMNTAVVLPKLFVVVSCACALPNVILRAPWLLLASWLETAVATERSTGL